MSKTITPTILQDIVERLQSGTSALIAESQALGFTHNGPLRAALKQKLGLEGYEALMGTRRKVAPTPVDDSTVPVITQCRVEDGWKIEPITVHHYREEVFVSPEEKRYVRAQGHERADLIVDMTKRGLGCARLRLLEGSSKQRAHRRHQAEVAHGEKVRNDRFKQAFKDPKAEPNDSLRRLKAQGRKLKRMRRKKT